MYLVLRLQAFLFLNKHRNLLAISGDKYTSTSIEDNYWTVQTSQSAIYNIRPELQNPCCVAQPILILEYSSPLRIFLMLFSRDISE